MTDYDPTMVMDASRIELIDIFRWVGARERKETRPITVLVGGWATYCYNKWYGSQDIDLITNSKTRQSLMHYLKTKRDFMILKRPMTRTSVEKKCVGGKIQIDFGSREDLNSFEGLDEQLPYSVLDGRTESRDIQSGCSMIVPERTLLLIFKLKAAWDRAYRLNNKTSKDVEWDRSKLRKDHADILALLDPEAGGEELDIQYLGEKLNEYSFLVGTLRVIANDRDAVNSYRRMNQEKARENIETLILLAEPRD